MTKQVKRYDLIVDCMCSTSDGKWVRYADIKDLEAEIERLRNIFEAMRTGGIKPEESRGAAMEALRPPFEITSGQSAGDPATFWQNSAPDAAAPAGGGAHSVVMIKR